MNRTEENQTDNMDNRFKCCKKVTANYVCVGCLEFFHPSCSARREGFVRLSAHKVYCSEGCQLRHSGGEEERKTMERRIVELMGVIKERDLYIARLKRQSKDFESSVCEVDEMRETESREQADTIAHLRDELKRAEAGRLALAGEVDSGRRCLQESRDRVVELEALSKNMISTIRTLEQDNEACAGELRALKSGTGNAREAVTIGDGKVSVGVQVVTLRGGSCANGQNLPGFTLDEETEDPPVQAPMPDYNPPDAGLRRNGRVVSGRPGRLVVLTDGYGRHLLSPMRKCFAAYFGVRQDVRLVVKPWAPFREVTSGSGCFLGGLTLDDYVVVLAGMEDGSVSYRDVSALADMCFDTNLIMCTVPAKYDGIGHYKGVNGVNSDIIRAVNRLSKFCNNVRLLDLQHLFDHRYYIRGTVFLNEVGLRKLCQQILCLVITFRKKKCNSNLVFIEPHTVCGNAEDSDCHLDAFLDPTMPAVVQV